MYRGEVISTLLKLRERLLREIAREKRQRAAFLTMPPGWHSYAYARTRIINKLKRECDALDTAIQSLAENG